MLKNWIVRAQSRMEERSNWNCLLIIWTLNITSALYKKDWKIWMIKEEVTEVFNLIVIQSVKQNCLRLFEEKG